MFPNTNLQGNYVQQEREREKNGINLKYFFIILKTN